jgi:putative lipoprotein
MWPTTAAELPVLSGTATYRERIALPPSAVFEATLEDVTRADVTAEVIGRYAAGPAGQVPIPFSIPYDASRIQPGRRYAVRARILVDDRPMFATAESQPVLTPGAPDRVTLVLRRATASVPTLHGTYWKLVRLGDRPIAVPGGRREPHLVFQAEGGRFAGMGGCNQLSGGYKVDGARIAFGQAIRTMMACADGMDIEQAFVAALERTRQWAIDGGQLELRDEGGRAVARFAARAGR